MQPADVVAGPIVRRADTTMIAIWLATSKPFDLATFVRPAGAGGNWIGVSGCTTIRAAEGLFVHLMIVTPVKDSFPTAKLLEYSIAVLDDSGGEDHAPFAKIVETDKLAYPGQTLPTMYLQAPGSTLNILYASCRKPHDENGGGKDALADGDDLILNNTTTLATRPAILCMIGDQIYGDDVGDETFDAMVALGATIEGPKKETLPKGLTLPGKGKRQNFVKKEAFFTSTYAKNHVITFGECAASYALAWNQRAWPGGVGSGPVAGFVATLPKVRRLLANVATYMIFDDHEVTDDWNISLEWFGKVTQTAMGSRIITNALFAFWLFQGWGNNPDFDAKGIPKLVEAADKRLDTHVMLEAWLNVKSRANGWEFFTPTYPFVYFLDTRTQRGHFDGFARTQTKAPAYLKSVDSWKRTMSSLQKLIARQGISSPLVLVATAPIFGYGNIDALQAAAGKFLGPYQYDEEGWAANRPHLLMFLYMCANLDVVVLSGDVHYSFTATASFSVFDSEFFRSVVAAFPGTTFPAAGSGATATHAFLYRSRFVQLNSSAAKNYADTTLEKVSRSGGSYGHIVVHDGSVTDGIYERGKIRTPIEHPDAGKGFVDHDPAAYKPVSVMRIDVNNPAVNTPYFPDHNIGYARITGRKIVNAFLVNSKATSERTFDFAAGSIWP